MGDHTPKYGGFLTTVIRLPSQLRQLHLQHLMLQLGPGNSDNGSLPGVLQDCNGLTSLHLQDCSVERTPIAFAAITALPELRRLEISLTNGADGSFLLGALPQHPWNLSALSLSSTAAQYNSKAWAAVSTDHPAGTQASRPSAGRSARWCAL
jgi:hypothetical protein